MEALCIMDTGILTPFSDESMAHGPQWSRSRSPIELTSEMQLFGESYQS